MQFGKILFFCFVLASSVVADDLSVKAFYPAGGQRGTTVEVKLIGKFPSWPVNIRTNDDLKTEANKEDEHSLKVTISADARPGVHWIRVYDKTGASLRRPFVVETVKELLEDSDECNGVISINEPRIINGILKSKNEVDQYKFSLEASEQFTFAVNANRWLGSPMDCVMQLVDLKHNVVVKQIDDSPGKDPMIHYSVNRAGEYAIRIFAFPETPNQTIAFAGGEDFVYRLTISKAGLTKHTIPLEISEDQLEELRVAGSDEPVPATSVHSVGFSKRVTAFRDGVPGWANTSIVDETVFLEAEDASHEAPMALEVPFRFTGCLSGNDSEDVFRFVGTKGTKLRFTTIARKLDLPLDPVVVIQNADGKQLAKNDDATGRDSTLDFTVPNDGDFYLVVRDLHGRSGSDFLYSLSVEEIEPGLELNVASEVFVATQSEELTIPIDVVRKDGYTEDVSIVVTGLPSDVSVSGGLSKMKQDTEKKVELKLKSNKAFSGPIQIAGLTKTSKEYHVATAPSVINGQRTMKFWLTVKSSGESEQATKE